MSGYILKAADRAATCTLHWRRGYLDEGETVTADLGWSVFPARPRTDALVVTERHHDADRSWAVFQGGRKGRFYLVSGRVRTSSGRELERAVVMRIATGPAPELRSSR